MSFDPQSGQNPYAPASGMQPPPKKSSYLWLYILLGVLGFFALGCCGCVGLGIWGFNKAQDELGKIMLAQAGQNPVVQEKLGDISSARMNLVASAQEAEENKGEPGILVFDVQGSKASGQLIVQQDGPEKLKFRELRISGGETINLDEGDAPAVP